jgi:hypothetical protein
VSSEDRVLSHLHVASATIGEERFSVVLRCDGGTPVEVRLYCSCSAGLTAALLEAYAAALTIGLEHGIPLIELLAPGVDMRFVPYGATDDSQMPYARSVIDWVARRLLMDLAA